LPKRRSRSTRGGRSATGKRRAVKRRKTKQEPESAEQQESASTTSSEMPAAAAAKAGVKPTSMARFYEYVRCYIKGDNPAALPQLTPTVHDAAAAGAHAAPAAAEEKAT